MRFELAPFDLPASYGESIVPLARAKLHARIEDYDEDDVLGIYRDAAIDMVERYCGVRLGPVSGLVWRGEALCLPLVLGVRPVTAITAVNWLDAAGAEVAGDATALRVRAGGELVLAPGAARFAGVTGGAEIVFDAGYTEANRPAKLVQAVLLFFAHLVLHREAVQTGTIASDIPLGFRELCADHRRVTI